MKKINNLYPYICDFNVILDMTYNVCSKVKNKKKVDSFERYICEHLFNIKKRLIFDLSLKPRLSKDFAQNYHFHLERFLHLQRD